MNWLPKHKCGLYLTHNEHKDSYEEIGQWIVDQTEPNDWVSEDEMERAIETDSVWALQWYPDTPIGFYRLTASSLDAIKVAVLEGQ